MGHKDIDDYESVLEQFAKAGNMKELHEKLRSIEDSYPDFVGGIMRYASTDRARKEKVIRFIDENPNAMSSQIIEFVSNQQDFHDAARQTEIMQKKIIND